ncbi:hypothetical protein [Algoriphagus sp. NG3]|uniref:hypothetical protein n=1 Tax=Algoriphagus sp. NG3 TaxID=3097546 RepID=UPI002A7FFB7C|nr:hypothetical protein [Algoriphagus sp. NG3]WPR77515.1 hypothetical protein SLW71_09160 [Algoriphagus sp. NG3]
MNLLFIIHIKDQNIGGSKISGIDAANRMAKNGHTVYLMADKYNYAVKSLVIPNVQIIHFKYSKFWIVKKTCLIFIFLFKKRFDKIITLDRQSAYISSINSYLFNIPIIPIIPGGGMDQLPKEPLKVPTIVFSEENRDNLIKFFNWDKSLIKVLPARIDIDKFSFSNIRHRSNRIAFISRISESKKASFIHFINEVKSNYKLLDLFSFDIVGDGDAQIEWSDISRNNNLSLNFIGAKVITSDFLKQYDLVIGQGRVILESISSGIPCSICGENGYFGLVTPDNFDLVKLTNFTGRSVVEFSSLIYDLDIIYTLNNNYFTLLKNYVLKNYDIALLISEIDTNPGFIVNFNNLMLSFKSLMMNMVYGKK